MLFAAIKFARDIVAEQFFLVTVAIVLGLFGLGYVLGRGFWESPPTTVAAWWFVHWWIGPVLFGLAVLVLAHAAERQSISIRDAPDALLRLRAKKNVTFGDAVDLLNAAFPQRSKTQILHLLLHAMWRGDFESRRGSGRLTIPTPDAIRHTNRGTVALKGDEADPNPPRTVFNRRRLLMLPLGLENDLYPSLWNLRKELQNEDGIRWSELKPLIKFDLLAAAEPGHYDLAYLAAYIHPLTMKHSDFIRWFTAFRRGRYEQ